ncbi:hypothetical protein CMV_002558 [Castanea mollissima]|uniref:Uncharacterized protein n=1 Tax=Castanea mollissima TaxID=60419 RepID=A0A8J4RY24_9ROSI|nr:hypothetical protein CMV_002558 [Castanea mollissima]
MGLWVLLVVGGSGFVGFVDIVALLVVDGFVSFVGGQWSQGGRPPRPSSSDSHLCVGLGLIYEWTLPSSRTRSTGSILCSDFTPPTTHTDIQVDPSISSNQPNALAGATVKDREISLHFYPKKQH